ncbi:hypothetical protein BDR06DRAFT_890924 [Suillus hirtellus]|nr:hypothetical protein BDR06DRAFT_890924 [Suillus hirtellus]
MNIQTSMTKQPIWAAWSMECLIHERSINLGLALDHSTNQSYLSALNSYINFCNIHHLSVDPTIDTLLLFVTFMLAHINPRSVNNYLSGVCSLLEEYYPYIRANSKHWFGVAIKRKLPLSRADLCTALEVLLATPSHNDLLFSAQLLDGFYRLMRLGELVWPDNPALQDHSKLILQTSLILSANHHSFMLPTNKTDVGGATSLAASGVSAECIQAMGRWSSNGFCIYIRKNPALLHALLFNGHGIHDGSGMGSSPFASI